MVTKGRTSALKGMWESAISGKQLDSVQEETLAVSATEDIVDKAQSSSPAAKTQTQIDGRKPSKSLPLAEKVSLDGKVKKRANFSLKELVRIRRVIVGILQSAVSANSATNVCRHTEADRQPNKKSKKRDRKGSVALLKESVQLGCVSQDSHPRKPILRKEVKLGSNQASDSPRARGTT